MTSELDNCFSQLTLNNKSDTLGFVTTSIREKPQLHHIGHFYRIQSKIDGKTTWRCVQPGCTGRCTTYGDTIGEEIEVTIVNDKHIEIPDLVKFQNLETRRIIKERSKVSNDFPKVIIGTDFVRSQHDKANNIEFDANEDEYSALRQVARRAQLSAQPKYPATPQLLSEINFPESLLTTCSRDQFLIHDSGRDDQNRFFVFGSLDYIRLIENNHVFADGTFNVAYVLLTRKTQLLYEKVLTVIKDLLNYHPKSITADYEKAFLNASH